MSLPLLLVLPMDVVTVVECGLRRRRVQSALKSRFIFAYMMPTAASRSHPRRLPLNRQKNDKSRVNIGHPGPMSGNCKPSGRRRPVGVLPIDWPAVSAPDRRWCERDIRTPRDIGMEPASAPVFCRRWPKTGSGRRDLLRIAVEQRCRDVSFQSSARALVILARKFVCSVGG